MLLPVDMINRGICHDQGSHRLEQSPRHNPDLLLVSNKYACIESLGSTEGTEAEILCSWSRSLRGSSDRVFQEELTEEVSNERSSACGSTSEERGSALNEKS